METRLDKFSELKESLQNIGFDEMRQNSESYFEGVVVKAKVAQLGNTLRNFFGVPVSPSKAKLPLNAENAINEVGGVRGGQTLYFRSYEDKIAFALLWPWQDGQRTTVKIVER